MIRRVLLLGAATTALTAGVLVAGTSYRVDESRSSIRFSVPYDFMIVGMVEGEFTDFSGEAEVDLEDLAASTVRVEIRAESLTTNFVPRDLSLRGESFFDVERHPRITYVGESVDESGARPVLHGRLELRGVEAPVEIPFDLLDFGDTLVVLGELELDRREFGIEGPLSSEEFEIGEQVTIRLHLVLSEKPAG